MQFASVWSKDLVEAVPNGTYPVLEKSQPRLLDAFPDSSTKVVTQDMSWIILTIVSIRILRCPLPHEWLREILADTESQVAIYVAHAAMLPSIPVVIWR